MSNELMMRKRLFKLYAANLPFYLDDKSFTGLFGCPICMRPFSEESILPETLEVNLAHIYQKSLGGKLCTLACKKCNSRLGERYEPHLTLEAKMHRAFDGTGTSSIDGFINWQGKRIPAKMNMDEEGRNVVLSPHLAKMPEVLALQAHLKTNPTDQPLHLSTNFPERQRQEIASLASAYLMMFREFGYEILRTTDVDEIRALLRSDDPPAEVPCAITSIPCQTVMTAPGELAHTVTLVRSADGMCFWGIPLPSPVKDKPLRCVLFPGPGKKGSEDYKAICRVRTGSVQCKCTVVPLPPARQRLVDAEARYFGVRVWNEMTGQKVYC